MTEERTLRPEQKQATMAKPQEQQEAPQARQPLMKQAQGVACPQCGTMNDAEAQFCASCGAPLHAGVCPNCGSETEPDADFCEVCHHYIRHDVCSFCGAHFDEHDGYCPQCGSPRGGIVCPTCHTLNDFSFCKQCGQPLTEGARALQQQMQELPEYKTLVALAQEYNHLQMELPCESERDEQRDLASQQLRERILRLLAQDEGIAAPAIPPVGRKRLSKEQLEHSKTRKMEQLSELLERLAVPPTSSPAKARNYAMAQKPAGVRLAWMCNYKQALHSSPCGCAKPQLGGKWIILGHNSKQEIKDDK